MGDMADYFLDGLYDEDAEQLRVLGRSDVYANIGYTPPTNCKLCGSKLVERDGKFGKFLACPEWPECRSSGYSISRSPMPMSEEDLDKMDRI